MFTGSLLGCSDFFRKGLNTFNVLLVHWCNEWIASLPRHHSVLDDSNGSIDLTAFPNWQDGWKWTGMGTCTIQSLSCIIDLSLVFILYSTSWSHSTVSEKWSATLFQWVTSVGATKAILCPARNIIKTQALVVAKKLSAIWICGCDRWDMLNPVSSSLYNFNGCQCLKGLWAIVQIIYDVHTCVFYVYMILYIYIHVNYVCYECLCVDA